MHAQPTNYSIQTYSIHLISIEEKNDPTQVILFGLQFGCVPNSPILNRTYPETLVPLPKPSNKKTGTLHRHPISLNVVNVTLLLGNHFTLSNPNSHFLAHALSLAATRWWCNFIGIKEAAKIYNVLLSLNKMKLTFAYQLYTNLNAIQMVAIWWLFNWKIQMYWVVSLARIL